MNMWDEGEAERSWYDVMQVCLNGHQVTGILKSRPENFQRFCHKCGIKTIYRCLDCANDIRGYHHVPGTVDLTGTPVPKRCVNCGAAYPWSVLPEIAHFSEFVQRCGDFIRKSSFSILELSLRVYIGKGLNHLPHPGEKCEILSSFYWSLREILEKAGDLNEGQLREYVAGFNAVLRSLESCLKDLLSMLAYDGELSLEVVGEYGKLQVRFNQVIDQYEQFLRKFGHPELTFMRIPGFGEIPKRIQAPDGERIFAPGSSYDVFKHVKAIVSSANTEVFVIESYPNEELFELYLDSVPRSVKIRAFVDQPQGNFVVVAKKFCSQAGRRVEMRRSKDIHDRVIFVDGRCWLIGQSIKDAAKTKPTAIVELNGAVQMKKVHDSLWNSAKPIC